MTNQLDTGDLWKSVDRLTRARRHRLRRTSPSGKSVVEYVEVPALWTQLDDARKSTTTGDGSPAKSTGSRSPLDLAITSLMHQVSTQLIAGLTTAGLRPRWLVPDVPRPTGRTIDPARRHPARDDTPGLGDPVIDPDMAGRIAERAARASANVAARRDSARRKHDVPADLAQFAAHIAAGAEGQDYVDDWVWRYRGWVLRAEEALALDSEDVDDVTGIRGRACPTCLGTKIAHYRDDGTYWEPALAATMRDGQLLYITCRVCGEGWWRGEGLGELGEQIAYSTTRTDDRSTA